MLLLAELFHRSYQERSLETNLESDCRRPWMLGQSLDLRDLSSSPFFSDLTAEDSARLPLSLPGTPLNQAPCCGSLLWAWRPVVCLQTPPQLLQGPSVWMSSYYELKELFLLPVLGKTPRHAPLLALLGSSHWVRRAAGLQGRPRGWVTWAGNAIPKNTYSVLTL